jgi:hypothetical protein
MNLTPFFPGPKHRAPAAAPPLKAALGVGYASSHAIMAQTAIKTSAEGLKTSRPR